MFDKDYYVMKASEYFKKPPEEVTTEERIIIKNLLFGASYGQDISESD